MVGTYNWNVVGQVRPECGVDLYHLLKVVSTKNKSGGIIFMCWWGDYFYGSGNHVQAKSKN